MMDLNDLQGARRVPETPPPPFSQQPSAIIQDHFFSPHDGRVQLAQTIDYSVLERGGEVVIQVGFSRPFWVRERKKVLL